MISNKQKDKRCLFGGCQSSPTIDEIGLNFANSCVGAPMGAKTFGSYLVTVY